MTSNKDHEKGQGPAAPGVSSRSQGRTIDLKAEEVAGRTDRGGAGQGPEGQKAEKEAGAGTDASKKPAPTRDAGHKGPSSGPASAPSSAQAAGRRGAFSFGAARIRVWALAAMAAIVGAVVALGVNALLARFSDSPDTQQLTALRDSLQQVSQRLETTRQEGEQARSQLQLRLTDLGGALETLGARLDQVEGDIAAAASDGPSLTQAHRRLSDLENALSALSTPSADEGGRTIDAGATVAELAELDRRVDALEATSGGISASAAGDGAANTRIDDLDRAATANKEAVAALQARIAALQQTQDAQAQRLETVVNEENAKIQTGEKLARRMAAEALRTTFQRGAAYSDLLDTAERLAGTGPAPEALRRFAGSGAPTATMLLEQFDAIANEIIEADRPATEGVADWLMQNARSLVTVRPTAPVEGESAEAIVSRIDGALASGHLQAALTEWQGLSAPAKAVSQQWADALASRAEADAALTQLTATLEGNGT
jgi:hypothetical protein